MLSSGEHGTDETECHKLHDIISVGIGSDPDDATTYQNTGCMLLYENGKCTGKAISIDLPYQGVWFSSDRSHSVADYCAQDEAKCRKFALKGGDFKSYRVRAVRTWGPKLLSNCPEANETDGRLQKGLAG